MEANYDFLMPSHTLFSLHGVCCSWPHPIVAVTRTDSWTIFLFFLSQQSRLTSITRLETHVEWMMGQNHSQGFSKGYPPNFSSFYTVSLTASSQLNEQRNQNFVNRTKTSTMKHSILHYFTWLIIPITSSPSRTWVKETHGEYKEYISTPSLFFSLSVHLQSPTSRRATPHNHEAKHGVSPQLKNMHSKRSSITSIQQPLSWFVDSFIGKPII